MTFKLAEESIQFTFWLSFIVATIESLTDTHCGIIWVVVDGMAFGTAVIRHSTQNN